MLRPHQINFIDDGFSAGKNGASKQFFFLKKYFDFNVKNPFGCDVFLQIISAL